MRNWLLIFLLYFSLQPALGFDDKDLSTIVESGNTGLIYVWSPLMPLSITGRIEIEMIAKELNLRVDTLIDPFYSGDRNSEQMESLALSQLGVLNHFPSLVLYSQGQLDSSIMLGYEPMSTLKKYIEKKVNFKERGGM